MSKSVVELRSFCEGFSHPACRYVFLWSCLEGIDEAIPTVDFLVAQFPQPVGEQKGQ